LPVLQTYTSSSLEFADSTLVVSKLSKRYKGGVWANRDIDLTGNAGELLGIMGPNGAGKTTLVRQITSELLPTSGTISVLGHDAVREPGRVKSLLGVVPQEATLFDYLTVHQHLRIFAKIRGIKPKEARARTDELVAALGLDEHRNVPVSTLSGGLKHRVLIGIAVLAQPPFLVLDEPTTGLDPQARRGLWSLLRQYKERGTLILLTTHSMEEAEALCDRVGIIQDGRMLTIDTVDNLRANHGFKFRITYFPDELTSEGVTLYGSDDQELVARVQEMGFSQFSISRANLEDVYLGLTGGLEGLDNGTS